MIDILGNRMKAYEEAYDSKIIRRLPIIIRVDGRNFSRLTQKIKRPFDPVMMDIMAHTMLHSAMEIEGTVFAYQQSDEITFVLKNDQSLESQPWFGNRVQKMIGVASSIATLAFYKYLSSLEIKPDLVGDPIFDARVFAVPSALETVNCLIWRQQDCIRNAITNAAQAELGKKFGKKTAIKVLDQRKTYERLVILKKECNIDFDTYYPTAFRRGIAAYKIPTIFNTAGEEVSRNKWNLDKEIPIFTQDKNFLLSIINSGHDIFRQKNITQ